MGLLEEGLSAGLGDLGGQWSPGRNADGVGRVVKGWPGEATSGPSVSCHRPIEVGLSPSHPPDLGPWCTCVHVCTHVSACTRVLTPRDHPWDAWLCAGAPANVILPTPRATPARRSSSPPRGF